MKRKFLLVTISFLLLIAAYWAYREYNRQRPDSKNMTAKFSVDADSLLKEFEMNEAEANKKYAGQELIIIVNGTVKNVNYNSKNISTILLGDTLAPSSIRCSMDSLYNNSLLAVNRGSRISIKGKFNGYKSDELGIGADIEMNFCVIEESINNNIGKN